MFIADIEYEPYGIEKREPITVDITKRKHKKFELGDLVKFDHEADNPYIEIKHKGKNIPPHEACFGSNESWWGYRQIQAYKLSEPLIGVVVGRTSICSGERDFEYEDGWSGTSVCIAFFRQTSKRSVYLIKTSLTGTNFKVLPEHMEKVCSDG